MFTFGGGHAPHIPPGLAGLLVVVVAIVLIVVVVKFVLEN